MAEDDKTVLTADEVETLKSLIEDWGWDYALRANREKVVLLAERFGLSKWAKDNRID